MARIFYQQDCDLQKLSGKTVAIIGYGSQGHAVLVGSDESLRCGNIFEIFSRFYQRSLWGVSVHNSNILSCFVFLSRVYERGRGIMQGSNYERVRS